MNFNIILKCKHFNIKVDYKEIDTSDVTFGDFQKIQRSHDQTLSKMQS